MNLKSLLVFVIAAIVTQLSKAFQVRGFPFFDTKVSRAIERAGGECSSALGGWCGGGEFVTPRSLLNPTDIVRLFNDIDKEMTSSFSVVNSVGSSFMPMDIKETKESYKLFIDLPGVDKKDIDIKVKGNELQITAKRESVKKDEDSEKFLTKERKGGSFQRIISLPDDADRKAISAENRNGVLELTIHKLPESIEKEMTIEIN